MMHPGLLRALATIVAISVPACSKVAVDPGTTGILFEAEGRTAVGYDWGQVDLTSGGYALVADDAAQKARHAMDRMLEAVRREGVPPDGIKLAGRSVGDYGGMCCRAVERYRLTFRDLDGLASVLGAAVRAAPGAGGIGYLFLRAQDLADEYAQARVNAVEEARRIAGSLAREAGLDLGTVARIDESQLFEVPQRTVETVPFTAEGVTQMERAVHRLRAIPQLLLKMRFGFRAAGTPGGPGEEGVTTAAVGRTALRHDLLFLRLYVNARSSATEEARRRVAGNREAIIRALEAGGVSSADIKRTGSGVHRGPGATQTLALEIYEIRLRDLDRAGKLLEDAANAAPGAAQITNANLEIGDLRPFTAKAREAAVEEARKTAAVLAGAFGLRAGSPRSVSVVEEITPNRPTLVNEQFTGQGAVSLAPFLTPESARALVARIERLTRNDHPLVRVRVRFELRGDRG